MNVWPSVKSVTPVSRRVVSFFRIDFSPSRIKVGAWARRVLLRFPSPLRVLSLLTFRSRSLLVVQLARSDQLRERFFVRSSLVLHRPRRVVTSSGYSRDNSPRLQC